MDKGFLMNFVDKPKLWGLSLACIVIIGLATAFGLLPVETLVDGVLIPQESGGFASQGSEALSGDGYLNNFDGFVLSYLTITGLHMKSKVRNVGITGTSVSRYLFVVRVNPILAVVVLGILFFAVVLVTRKSNSAIFVLGPFIIISLVLMLYLLTRIPALNASVSGGREVNLSTALSMSSSAVQVSFQALTFGLLLVWPFLAGFAALVLARIVRQTGLIAGIDSVDEKLDFSRLKAASMAGLGQLQAAGKAVASTLEDKITSGQAAAQPAPQAGNPGNPAAQPAAQPVAQPASQPAVQPAMQQAPPPWAFSKLIAYCPMCRSNKFKGSKTERRCKLCQLRVGVLKLPDGSSGQCSFCSADVIYGAKFCWQCGSGIPQGEDG